MGRKMIPLKELAESLSNQTIDSYSKIWLKFCERAKKVKKNIEQANKKIDEDAKKYAMMGSQGRTRERRLQEIKNIQLLKTRLIQGYTFIQELRQYIKNEEMQYMLLFADNKSESIGIFSLEQILPTLNITISKDGDYTLQINNLTQLEKLKSIANDTINGINEHFSSVIQLYNELLNRRRALVREKRQAQEKDEEKKKKIFGYERGQEGIAFEQAVRRVANILLDPNNNQSVKEILSDKNNPIFNVNDFKADTQVFYRAGDLNTKQVQAILDEKERIMQMGLELKAVRTKTKSGYAMGARLSGFKTIMNGLNKIIKILKNPSYQEIQRRLEELFSSKEDEINAEIETNADDFAQEVLNKNLSNVLSK